MDFKFPRTVAELAATNRRVVVHCDACQRHREISPDVLDMTFGPDFDVYAGYQELGAQLRCEECGEGNRRIDVMDRTHRAGPVSFEDSVNHQLEMNALIRARDGERRGPLRAPARRAR